MGKKIQIVKSVKANGVSVIINEKKEKMGPIYLDISLSRLYEAWDEQALQEVEDFHSLPGQKVFSESWIFKPSSLLFFTLNRVQYDVKSQSLVKNNGFFHFER